VELLVQKESGSASFGAKVVPSLQMVNPSFMNSVTGSVCRAKCSNILQDMYKKFWGRQYSTESIDSRLVEHPTFADRVPQ
jgi:hypothetical protein